MKTIRIEEEFIIPGTDVVLEEGDTIRILKESDSVDFGLPTFKGYAVGDFSNPDRHGYETLIVFSPDGREEYPIQVSRRLLRSYSKEMNRFILDTIEDNFM